MHQLDSLEHVSEIADPQPCSLVKCGLQRNISGEEEIINPIDPNPAISAHAVFPQSSRFSKRFFQIRTTQNVRTAHRGAIYQIKAYEKPFWMQRESFSFDK